MNALGAKAIKKPSSTSARRRRASEAFEKTAIALEDTGVSAYAGQGPLIKDKKILAAALSVHSVEARHAAWIRASSTLPAARAHPPRHRSTPRAT